MITGIKVNNIRNLDFKDYVELSPLTILLGKNSSGKSTFLRTFPLIKQSLDTKRSTPLLWYGNLVDFGSFDETLNKNSTKKEISFSFRIEVPHNEKSIKKNNLIFSTISIKKEKEQEFISKIEINYLKNKFTLYFSSNKEINKIEVNNSEYTNFRFFYRLEKNEFFPSNFEEIKSDEEFSGKRYIPRRVFSFFYKIRDRFEDKICNEIEDLLKLNIEDVKEKIYSNLFSDEEGISDILKNIRKVSSKKRLLTFLKKIDLSISDIEKIEKFSDLVLLFFLERILYFINEEIFMYFNNILYIAPLRATAQRYYRIQGLDIENIDSTGSNLPIYLKNLDDKVREEFCNWTQENFGFKPKLISNGGHISLVIDKKKSYFNLADTGFGFSQILPILLQIWNKVFFYKRERIRFFRRNNNILFFIEQPELHLHPAMQASLIDVFIKTIKLGEKKNFNIKFILETHSEVVINRIGRHIVEENFNNKKTEIIIFENDDNGEVKLIKTNITEEGIIENWPSGFFEPKEIQK